MGQRSIAIDYWHNNSVDKSFAATISYNGQHENHVDTSLCCSHCCIQ